MKTDEILILVNYLDLENQLAAEYLPCKWIDETKWICELIFPPFFAPNLAQGDQIQANFNHENTLTWQDTIVFSGNSTVHVVELCENGLENVLDKLANHHLLDKVRQKSPRYAALNIPKQFDYAPIQKILLDFEHSGQISFQESCLSEKHHSENIQRTKNGI